MIDLLVAGGGPAGLATAVYGARAGLDVVVIERRPGTLDKACGEGLMPHTVGRLDRLGVAPHGMQLSGIVYLEGHRRVDATFRGATGRGVRRTVLHAALQEAARSARVRVVSGDAGPTSQDAGSVRAGGLRARYLAAADGLHSSIRRAMGLSRPSRGPRRWGSGGTYHTAPWSDHVEVHWGPGSEAYVTPVADDCVGISILTSSRGGFDRHPTEFPALADRVREPAHGPDRAAGPLRQTVRNRTAGRVLLVGDAAGYIDALTGEGMGPAFGTAELLVNCVVAELIYGYDRRWRALTHRSPRVWCGPGRRRRSGRASCASRRHCPPYSPAW